MNPEKDLLDIEEGEGDGLPEVVAVLAGDLEVLVPLLLNQRVVLDRHSVPHVVFLHKKILSIILVFLSIFIHFYPFYPFKTITTSTTTLTVKTMPTTTTTMGKKHNISGINNNSSKKHSRSTVFEWLEYPTLI